LALPGRAELFGGRRTLWGFDGEDPGSGGRQHHQ
jgi:hypothetical protein